MIQSESVLGLSSDSSVSVSSCLSLTNLSAFSLHHTLPVANSLSLSRQQGHICDIACDSQCHALNPRQSKQGGQGWISGCHTCHLLFSVLGGEILCHSRSCKLALKGRLMPWLPGTCQVVHCSIVFEGSVWEIKNDGLLCSQVLVCSCHEMGKCNYNNSGVEGDGIAQSQLSPPIKCEKSWSWGFDEWMMNYGSILNYTELYLPKPLSFMHHVETNAQALRAWKALTLNISLMDL